MKQKFIRHYGEITESLELGLEENWTYIHYKKGTVEKTACVLNNSQEALEDYLENFYKENLVSEEIIKDVHKFLQNEQNSVGSQWRKFVDFLLRTMSLQIVFGITVIIAVFAGYKLGTKLDSRFGRFPLFTVTGLFAGIGIGGLTIYSMVLKYFNPEKADKTNTNPMASVKKTEAENIPPINATLDDVRHAVRIFSKQLPKGVYRTILVGDDNQIDFTQLIPILGGMPAKKFYMSKETYDLFEEKDKQIPFEMDTVQKAVDQFVKEHHRFPVLEYDPLRRINYFALCQEHYLKSKPQITFYLTDLDGMITHIKPNIKLKERR